MSTGGPPDVRFTAEWPDVSKDASFAALVDLPVLLRELYTSAPIEEIYAGVRPDYRRYIDEYRAAVVTQVVKVMAYCRVSALSAVGGGEVPHAVVIPNLLQSFNNKFSFVLDDTFDSIEGPRRRSAITRMSSSTASRIRSATIRDTGPFRSLPNPCSNWQRHSRT